MGNLMWIKEGSGEELRGKREERRRRNTALAADTQECFWGKMKGSCREPGGRTEADKFKTGLCSD